MKTFTKLLLLLSTFLLISQISFGQSFLDRVKQKTKEKIEQRIDEKVDKEIDKGLDKVENSIDSIAGTGDTGDDASETSARQNRMSQMLQGMGMSGDPVPIEDSYSFTQLVAMEIEMYDNEASKSNTGEFITHLNPNSNSLAYEVVSNDIGDNDQGIFIIDTKNEAIILLNGRDGEKTGMVYGMGSFMESFPSYEDETIDDADLKDASYLNPNVKKTGKTKKVAGYKCEQYVYKTDETESEFWITDELKTSNNDFFSTLFKTSAFTNGMGYGYVMESINKDITTGNKSSMKVTKVDNHSSKNFDLSSFQITNLGTFQMPSGEEE